jgi:hypothetical protein
MKLFITLPSLLVIASAAPAVKLGLNFDGIVDCADAYEDCYKYASDLYEKSAWYEYSDAVMNRTNIQSSKVTLGACFKCGSDDGLIKNSERARPVLAQPIYCQSACYEEFRTCREAAGGNMWEKGLW